MVLQIIIYAVVIFLLPVYLKIGSEIIGFITKTSNVFDFEKRAWTLIRIITNFLWLPLGILILVPLGIGYFIKRTIEYYREVKLQIKTAWYNIISKK